MRMLVVTTLLPQRQYAKKLRYRKLHVRDVAYKFPCDILTLPKAPERRQTRWRKGRLLILTGTPDKIDMRRKQKEKMKSRSFPKRKQLSPKKTQNKVTISRLPSSSEESARNQRGTIGQLPPPKFWKRMHWLGAATSYIILPPPLENIGWLWPRVWLW